eukprot:m.27931 g.27931  ORF g.27931 m.27931 type:complete len:502 (-) comp4477_c0_seq1:131-1636(-)
MTACVLLGIVLLAAHVCAQGADSLQLTTSEGRLLDQDGRERIFHGTNIVFKGPPYHPSVDAFDAQFSFCDEDMALLQSMGYNSIRLSVPWAGVEPQDGVFNFTYLATMRAIVDRAAQYGIYSLIDFHQDAWNAKFCGNGVPDWAAPPKANDFPVPITAHPVPVDPATGHPNRSTCDDINNNNWSAFYLTYATSTAVGAVYDNQAGLRDKLAQYWRTTASVFANSTTVLGYELMNEPFAGNVYADPLLLVPGVADREKLQPMYDQINTAIREVDDHHLILFQGVTWEVVVPIGEVDGFQHVPGGPAYANRSVLSWHCSVTPKATPDSTYFKWKDNEAKRLGAGRWVTETGVGTLDLLDLYSISWMHWDYKWFANLTWDNPGLFKTDGPWLPCANRTSMADCLDRSQPPQYARTYAKAVAGKTQSFVFNSTTRIAVLNYDINPNCRQPTILFASTTWIYPKGFSVELSPSNIATWTLQGPDHIIVTHTTPVIGGALAVTITPN